MVAHGSDNPQPPLKGGLLAPVPDYPPPRRDASPRECARWATRHPSAANNTDRDILNRLAFLATLDRAELGGAYPTLNALAAHVGRHRRTVIRRLRRLAALGVLTIESRHGATGAQASNVYRLTGAEGQPRAPAPSPAEPETTSDADYARDLEDRFGRPDLAADFRKARGLV